MTDQPRMMPRLLWVIAGHMGHFVGFVLHRLKSYFIIIISETMILTHQKDVEAEKRKVGIGKIIRGNIVLKPGGT